MIKFLKYIIFVGWYAIYIYPRYFYYKITKNKKTSYDVRYNKTRKTLKFLNKLLNVKCHLENTEKIPEKKGCLFIGNHQSFYDPLALISCFDDRKFVPIAKKESIKYPIAGKIIYAIDSLFLDRKDLRSSVKIVRTASDILNENDRDVLLFPEGTRTKNKDYSMNEFKPGSLKTAYYAKAPIVPFAIDDTHMVLNPKINNMRTDIKIRFLDPIMYEDYKDLTTQELANKLHALIEANVMELDQITFKKKKK